MKKRLILAIIFAVVIQSFGSFFVYVDAKDNANPQPAVCAGPSEMMQKYFEFQNEMMGLVLWTELAKKRFETQRWTKWLFQNEVVSLGDGSSTLLDLVSTSVKWNLRSAVSTSITSMFLLSLSLASVVQANTEWLWILFKDRPIVRDYKQMLDIESNWIEMAFFLSESGNLAHITVNTWDVVKLIKKYQKEWLFTWNVDQKAEMTVANIMMDMVIMNGYMKHFILYKKWLSKYKASMNNKTVDKDNNITCNTSFCYRFSDEAIQQLENDYKWIGTFGACNHYGSNFVSTIEKWLKDNITSMNVAMEDVKNSMNNLGNLFGSSRWGKDANRCEMSEYEMAQLKAYRWWNRNCQGGFVDVDGVDLSLPNNFTSIKKSQQDLDKKTDNTLNKTTNNDSSSVWEKSKNKKFDEKSVDWYVEYWTWSWFNSEFNYTLDGEMKSSFNEIMLEFNQAQRTAIAWDISMQLIKIKWLIDQIWAVSIEAEDLEWVLKKIADYQCWW